MPPECRRIGNVMEEQDGFAFARSVNSKGDSVDVDSSHARSAIGSPKWCQRADSKVQTAQHSNGRRRRGGSLL